MTNRLRKIAERLKEGFDSNVGHITKAGKPLAVMAPCPGVVNDGLFGHSMRDGCRSCAPFWEQYPTCPVHRTKLSSALYCRECRKFYARPAELDLRSTEQEADINSGDYDYLNRD